MPSTSCSEYSEYQIQEKYLINTQKIVKGHKITLKDTIRKQLMKSRGQTRNKAAQTAEPSEKITEYTEKYHALETIDDEHQMLRFIFYKRFKESRASQRGIKLFSRQTTRPRTTHTQIERQSQRFGATARLTKTSNDKRTLENESKYKSLEYQVHNSLNDNTKKPTIHFSSENIDPKMTEYLNLILQKKEKDEMEITELELREMSQGITERETRAKMEEQRQRSLNNSFLRRMKKQQNRGYGMQGKYERQGEYRRGEGCGSDQLVKSLKRKRFAQRAANDFHNAFRKNNSIESDESANSSKLSKDRKVEKSYLKTFTAKTGEKDLKEMRTAMTSARRELY